MADHQNVFAVTDPNDADTPRCLFVEDAHKGVISVSVQPIFSEQTMRQYSPYLWQYPAAPDVEFAELGRWACQRLAGLPAVHGTGTTGAPPSPMQTTRRKFGLLYEYSPSPGVPTSAPLVSALQACGQSLDEVDWLLNNGPASDTGSYQSGAQNAIVHFRQNGDTTIFVVAANWSQKSLAAAADYQSFYPEWVMDSQGEADYDIEIQTFWSPGQSRGLMGISQTPKQVPFSEQPPVWAIKEVDPGYTQGTPPGNYIAGLQFIYRALLLIASGIQMAGPHLTPGTFEQKLFTTQFPNPPNSIYAGAVGFSGGSHAMTTDTAEIFWSPSTPDPYGGSPGAWCYVDHGVRRTPDQYPKGEGPLFNQPCDP
jgi:hypothetical protein